MNIEIKKTRENYFLNSNLERCFKDEKVFIHCTIKLLEKKKTPLGTPKTKLRILEKLGSITRIG